MKVTRGPRRGKKELQPGHEWRSVRHVTRRHFLQHFPQHLGIQDQFVFVRSKKRRIVVQKRMQYRVVVAIGFRT
ncbi:uncharacterized protein CCR75_006827 [Bremia lactucae]|uniref:Uncharacterized protein n=1 Tax=Bremia lactucae TaxID=4779 RepID=A0A976FEJ1_BRELC|nr:hypothetical protein CCR75_006827 [Bremia lactucae]